MSARLGVDTGRRWQGRLSGKSHRCESCSVRLTYGEPNPNGFWSPRLRLSEDQVNYLLVAAAEFDAISTAWMDDIELDSGVRPERPTAVEWTDWLRPSVIGDYVAPPDFDGAPPRTNDGLPTTDRRGNQRHPDPLPVASLRHWRKP